MKRLWRPINVKGAVQNKLTVLADMSAKAISPPPRP